MTDEAASDGVRRLARDPARLDSLDLYSHIVRSPGGHVADPTKIDEAVRAFRDNLVRVTGQAGTVHGWRIQALFEAMVASLGQIRLLKMEDAGSVYISGAAMKPPDFRVITAEGEQILVEVKSCFQNDPTDDLTFRAKDIAELREYASVVGVDRVLLAIYWVKWNLWTLTDLSRLEAKTDTKLAQSMLEAVKANEMGALGDRTIATEWPLTVRFLSDKAKPRTLVDGKAEFTIGAVQVLVAGREVTDAEEQSIVWRLMFHTDWAESDEAEVEDGELTAVRFDRAPEPPPPASQRFAMHPPLSSIFSSIFHQATTDEDGEITALRIDVDPGAIARLVPDAYHGDTLRIWRFHVIPTTSDGGGEV